MESVSFMAYIQGVDREQLQLFTEKIDDLVDKEHIVRFIDAYVNKLDLAALEVHNIENHIGAPGYIRHYT